MSNKFETEWIKRRAGKLCLVILLSAILLLSGCGEAGTDVMTLKRIPYAGDIVNEVPELVNSTEGLEIFEFTLDEGISGYSVDVWYLENGQWVSGGRTVDTMEQGAAWVGIQLTETGCSLFTENEYGVSRVDFDFSTGLDMCPDTNKIRWMLEEEGITPGFEQQLMMDVGWRNDQEAKNKYSCSDFREVDCDAGAAITITFTPDDAVETA